MKIRAFLMAIALVAFALPVTATSPDDKATGNGIVSDRFGTATKFNLSAHSDADGANADGSATYQRVIWVGPDPAPQGKVDVTDLNVAGDTACVAGAFRGDPETWPFGPGYPYAIIVVVDNGPASADPGDTGVAFGVTGGDCDDWTAFGLLIDVPLTQGNIGVIDAT